MSPRLAFPARGPAIIPKAITLVVPYGAGGASDLAGRAFGGNGAQTYRRPADYRREQARQRRHERCALRFRSDPDGYTLLLSRVMALYPAVHKDSPVHWDDYTFLGILESSDDPRSMSISPIETVDDLIAKIKSGDGRHLCGIGAPRSTVSPFQALLADAGLDPLTASALVPYKGGGALAAAALLGIHVDFLAIAAGSLMPHIRAGDTSADGLCAQAHGKSPNVPTIRGAGL